MAANRLVISERRGCVSIGRKERLFPVMSNQDLLAKTVNSDIRAVIDDELVRLPEDYRQLIILCDLGRRPHDLVAREMQLRQRSLRKRLERARRLLHKRLIARGITTLSIIALLEFLQAEATAFGVPSCLIKSTGDLVEAAMSGRQRRCRPVGERRSARTRLSNRRVRARWRFLDGRAPVAEPADGRHEQTRRAC